MRTLRGVVGMAVLATFLAGAGCGDDDGEVGTGDGSSTTTTGAAETTTTTGGGTTTTAGGIDPLEGASTEPVSGGSEAIATALLTRVELGRHEGFDRVVFEFQGDDMPSYNVEYTDPPILEDASGDPVDVDGDFFLVVRFFPASGFDMEAGEEVYTGPDSITGASAQTSQIREVVRTGDFEAVLTWVVGLADEVDFRVTEMQNPTRLVIDVRNH